MADDIWVTESVKLGELPSREYYVVDAIIQTNAEAEGISFADFLAKKQNGELGPLVSTGFNGIRSAHGIAEMRIDPYFQGATYACLLPAATFPQLTGAFMRAKNAWKQWSESAATAHAKGKVPAVLEFTGSGKEGGRLLFDYIRDLVFYSPNHYGYADYTLILNGTAPQKTYGAARLPAKA